MKQNDFQDKNVLITGGSSGIGFALASQFIANGATVVLVGRRASALSAAREKLCEMHNVAPSCIIIISLDIRNFDNLSNVLSQHYGEIGCPDIVIHSAGTVYPAIFDETPIDEFHLMMDTNYFGAVNLFQWVVPRMKRRKSGQLCTMGSASSFLSIWGYSAYSGSKFALKGLCDALRSELKPYQIAVSIVFPPDTDTPQLQYENQFKPAITRSISGTIAPLSPDFVAAKIIEGIEKKRYIIIPDKETKFFYWLTNVLGTNIYKVVDIVTSQAIRKNGLEPIQKEKDINK